MEKIIKVGVILSPHGVRGNFKIRSFTSPADNIFRLKLMIDGQSVSLIKKNQAAESEFICALDNVKNKEEAAQYKAMEIFCRRDSMPQPDINEFYLEDLKGLRVINSLDNKPVGKVKSCVNYGAGDLLEIKFDHKKQTMLFAFTEAIFPQVTPDHIVINIEKTFEAELIEIYCPNN